MKTLPEFREILSGKSTLTFALLSFSILASCTKDELMGPVSSQAAAQSVAAKNPPASFPYEILVIDHKAGGWSFGPDYKVTMLSNGTGIFEGRKNVGTLKTIKFAINHEAFIYIRNLLASSNFFEIKDVPYVPDAAETFTTYSDGRRKETKRDFGLGEPAVLIKLRQLAEKKMEVQKYIIDNDVKQQAVQYIAD